MVSAARIWLVCTQVAGVISLGYWFPGAVLFSHYFEELQFKAVLEVVVWIYPLILVGASVEAWRNLGKNKPLTACVTTALPLSYLALIYFSFMAWV